jgi:hypothetical protein
MHWKRLNVVLSSLLVISLLSRYDFVHASFQEATEAPLTLHGDQIMLSVRGANDVILMDSSGYKGYDNKHVEAFDNAYAVLVKNGHLTLRNSSIGILMNSSCTAYDKSFVYAHYESIVDAYGQSTVVLFGSSVARVHGCSVNVVHSGVGKTRVEYPDGIGLCIEPYMPQAHAVVMILIVCATAIVYSRHLYLGGQHKAHDD